MRPAGLVFFVAVLACAACGGGGSSASPAVSPDPFSGGTTTIFNTSNDAFGFPAANLEAARSDPFFVGNSFFNTNWVAAPSSTVGRDGLGPIFNARSCSACHLRDGRGQPPTPGEQPVALLFRIGLDGTDTPDPVYGQQLQNFSVLGVPEEASVTIVYTEVSGTFRVGTPYSLRRPIYGVAGENYGPLAPGALLAPRIAPFVFGLGLLASLDEETVRSRADPLDEDGDGISGRAALVVDGKTGEFTLGRFGWKAEQPTLEQQTAAAFRNDLGLTNPLFPDENCTPGQPACSAAPNGGTPEISQEILDFVTFYMHTLAVPGRRAPDDPQVREGARLFQQARCSACHVPTLETGVNPEFPELSGQVIHPYTDLLLHDMGPDLADGLAAGDAGPSEWRTPPLWGIGLVQSVSGHTTFLHDGRARDLVEAILWHGGEAAESREAFRRMTEAERNALIRFLEDL